MILSMNSSLLMQRNPLLNVQKKQRRYYSGKKKRHILKTLVVVDKTTGQIVCIFFAYGKVHDFRLFKRSKMLFKPEMLVGTDSGFQGIKEFHLNVMLPKKRTKKNPLSKEDKKQIINKKI